jgi:hypothetical protein
MSRTSELTAGHPQAEMPRGGHPATPADAARSQQDVLRGLDGKQACPFCGAVSEKSPNPCARCGMDNTPEARKATKARIGPWYVLQARNPAAPGMRFDTLLTFVRKGRVRARSVVRGPTTHQLWRFAAHVKGLSREFGLCFSCGSSIETTANICPQCNRLQEPPINPDVLLDGLGADEGSSAAPRVQAPVFRELPAEPVAAAPAPPVAPPAARPPEPEPEPDEIVIPALGGFGPDDLVPKMGDSDPLPGSLPPAAGADFPASAPPGRAAAFATPAPRPAPAPAAAPAARAADENPFSIPPVRKKANGDPGFLSAKDLAAAFKLSFDPSAELDRVEVPDRMPASALPEGLHPAVTVPRNPLGSHAPPPARRGGAFGKVLLFLIVMALSGFAVLMWVDPVARQRTVDWCKATVARLRSGTTTAAPAPRPEDEFDAPLPTTAPATDDATDDAEATDPELDADIDSDAAATTDPQPDAVPADTTPRAVAEEPAEQQPLPPPAVRSNAGAHRAKPRAGEKAGSVKPRVEPEPAAPAPDEAAADAPPPPAPAEPAPTFKTAQDLKRRALIAEAEGDYATAVGLYEQIKKLVKQLHPSDLDFKLNFARSQLK